MNDRILAFLRRAKKATYAGHGAEVASSRCASHDLRYEEEGLLYYDTYLGSEKFAGEEALWENGVPFWAMNYVGRVLADGFSGDFLKEALALTPQDRPYRGPARHESGEYRYECSVTGDFEWFHGFEEIFKSETRVYECRFHGGRIL